MSSLGSSGTPAVARAQSLAVSQRPDSAKTKGDNAAAAQWRQTTATGKPAGDVADVASSSDRDADGRRLDHDEAPEPTVETTEAPPAPTPKPRRRPPPDPTGRRGKQLDVET